MCDTCRVTAQRGQSAKKNDNTVTIIEQMASEGVSLSEMGRQLGFSGGWAKKIYVKNNINYSEVKDNRVEKIRELAALKLSLTQMAKITGISSGGIHHICVKYNIEHGVEIPNTACIGTNIKTKETLQFTSTIDVAEHLVQLGLSVSNRRNVSQRIKIAIEKGNTAYDHTWAYSN